MKQKTNITSLHKKETDKEKDENSVVSSLSPREIVSELDRYVIGQNAAKRAVAIALRNRWRRQALKGEMKDEVLPKNILMIGPTGVGKTEISRRLSKLAEAPIIKVEAPRFTEVGCTYRAFWKTEYDEIKHNFVGKGPEFSPEMMIEFIRNNKRVIEIPISYYTRLGGKSKYSGNKLAILKTGFKMLSLILKKRLN